MAQPRSVLLIAFHFPPLKGSSGVQRTLRFAQHLPKYGWEPVVLTIDPRAYEALSGSPGNEIPAGLEVHRAFGVDAARTLSLFGRYPRSLALPDRWASWRLWAVRRAMRLIGKRSIDAIWSTFPIATAHAIGLQVAQRTGLPWIAEFRDPMWQGDYPPDSQVNRCWRELEQQTVARADATIVTAPSAVSLYRERFPWCSPSRITLIENGYDDETFRRAGSALGQGAGRPAAAPERARPLRILHSGIIYPSERDPTELFAALAGLKRRGIISSRDLQIVLRASGSEHEYRARLEQLDIADVVRLEPPIPYLHALEEMLTADGLLILQAANCNAQVPAKLYEYLRAQRPILALTDRSGDTGQTLERLGTGLIAPLDSAAAIEAALVKFLEDVRSGAWPAAEPAALARLSREAQAGQLAERLEAAVAASDNPNVKDRAV